MGTPQGDIGLVLELNRVNGKLEGTISAKQDNKPVTLDKVEETADKLVIHFKMSGFNINVTYEIEDNDTLKGSMMGMFKTKAVRVK